MCNKTKEIILKIVIVTAFSAMLLVVPGAFIYCWFLDEKTSSILISGGLIVFGIFGVILMIMLPIFGLKQKPVKAEKTPLIFASYDELLAFLQKRLLQREYQLQKRVPISPDGEVTVYVKPSKGWTLSCLTIIRVSELSDELIETANKNITQVLNEYYDGRTITDTINMISLFCVDRITSAFQKLVNSSVHQGFKNGRLIVGASFGGKSMYIARQKDGFAVTKYKRLRKELIDLLE